MATSPVTLLFQPFNAIIDTLVLDAAVKEEHTSENDVTENPVERGSATTDHIRPKPEELTIEGVVSNTPLNSFQTNRAVTYEGVTFTSNATTNIARGMPGNAEAAYAKLLDLRNKGNLITVVTALRTYDNMAVLSVKVPRDKDTGDILKFEIKLKQVRIVTNAVTVVATKKPAAKPPQKLGTSGSVAVRQPLPGISLAQQNAFNAMPQVNKPPPAAPIPGSGF